MSLGEGVEVPKPHVIPVIPGVLPLPLACGLRREPLASALAATPAEPKTCFHHSRKVPFPAGLSRWPPVPLFLFWRFGTRGHADENDGVSGKLPSLLQG